VAVAVPAPDPAAQRAALLYERHHAAVLAYCIWRLRARFDAEEAAQTTFTRALSALRRGHHPHNERAWLVTIARNVCTTLGTAPHRALEVAGDVPQGLSDETDDGLAPELESALAALPEGQRRALLLREWHELSYREIAAELGVSVGTVESWIFRARRSLASALGSARRHLGLASLLRSVAPSTGAKVAATAALATAVVATEQAVVAQPSDGPAPRLARERIADETVAGAGASPHASFVTERRRAPRPTRHDVDARRRAGKPERPPVVTAARTLATGSSTEVPAPTTRPGPEAKPTSPPPARPLEQPSVPPIQAPTLPPVEPPPLPPVQTPSLPVPAPELPPVPEVAAPALPVDVPQVPQTTDLPVTVPKLP
jgi:RNA polymerase sigma-70 factor (ECF subfamily)